MGEYITIGDGLVITLFSMVIVFITLLAISYLIDLLTILVNRREKKKAVPETEVKVDKEKIVKESKESSVEENIDDEELVAVISAAIAASLGVAVPQINIRSIKRTQSVNNVWSEMGKAEQISGKL